MMLIRLVLILVMVYFIADLPNYALAVDYDSSFRCGTEVIQLGDSNYRVLAKCGPPNAREFIGTNYRYAIPAGEFRDVEQWIYNLGNTDFIYTLMFQGGSLMEISRGGRGF